MELSMRLAQWWARVKGQAAILEGGYGTPPLAVYRRGAFRAA